MPFDRQFSPFAPSGQFSPPRERSQGRVGVEPPRQNAAESHEYCEGEYGTRNRVGCTGITPIWTVTRPSIEIIGFNHAPIYNQMRRHFTSLAQVCEGINMMSSSLGCYCVSSFLFKKWELHGLEHKTESCLSWISDLCAPWIWSGLAKLWAHFGRSAPGLGRHPIRSAEPCVMGTQLIRLGNCSDHVKTGGPAQLAFNMLHKILRTQLQHMVSNICSCERNCPVCTLGRPKISRAGKPMCQKIAWGFLFLHNFCLSNEKFYLPWRH